MKKVRIVCTLSEEDVPLLNQTALQMIDLLEIRLDLFSSNFIESQLPNLLNTWQKNLIFTYRLPNDSSEQNKSNLSSIDIEKLLHAFASPSNYLDIELNQENTIFKDFHQSSYSKIYSWHDFSGTMSLHEMTRAIESCKEENKNEVIFKFAVKTESLLETATFLQAIHTLSKTYNMTGICMGEKGVVSRIFGDLYGSLLTYCSLDKERAPGQVSIATFHLFRNF